MAEIVTRKLGLAAFIKMHGGRLNKHESGTGFVFEVPSEKTLEDWEFDYLNSCCHRHDTELVNLRRLLR